MSPPLSGRVVLVTGGGRGIGRSHCLELARLGAAVVVNDPGVNSDGSGGEAGPAATVVGEIQAAGGQAVAHTGSVASWDDAADMIKVAVDTFGTLTGVVNNAGIVRDATVANATEADWDAVMAVHLKGTFAVSRHACAYWRAEAKGRHPGRRSHREHHLRGRPVGQRGAGRIRRGQGGDRQPHGGDRNGDAPLRRRGQRDLPVGGHPHQRGILRR